MTDRKPDDLYDALRERLTDYGQEPPAQLWADIRAQLPPPVAPPQLRRRRRRAAVALLLLLVAAVRRGLAAVVASGRPATADCAARPQPGSASGTAPIVDVPASQERFLSRNARLRWQLRPLPKKAHTLL